MGTTIGNRIKKCREPTKSRQNCGRSLVDVILLYLEVTLANTESRCSVKMYTSIGFSLPGLTKKCTARCDELHESVVYTEHSEDHSTLGHSLPHRRPIADFHLHIHISFSHILCG